MIAVTFLIRLSSLLVVVSMLVSITPSVTASQRLRASRNSTSSLLCHITMEVVSTGNGVGQHHHYECSPVERELVSDYSYVVDLPTDFVEQHATELLGGTLFAEIPGGQIVDNTVVVPPTSVINIGQAPASFQERRRRLSSTSGTRSLLVLRISSNDATPDYSAQQYYKYIFNENDDTQPTLKSQYKKMSFGKLNIVPTKYGVMDVRVNMKANGATTMAVRDAAIAAVTSKYSVSSITDLADHVMLCLPPGTGDWAGSSPINSWRLVLNNQWCGFVSGTIHEMGHNLGLLHSNAKGVQYMDFTSYMSAGYATPYFPAKSFNGANNWQFGWYSDRHKSLNPAQGGQMVRLATFVDYGKSNKNYPVLIKVGSGTYLQYNRAKGFNYQAQQMVNQVTVVQQQTNGTNIEGGIDPSSDSKLTIANFEGSGRSLVIQACRSGVGSSSDPDWMDVSIGYDKSYCAQSAAKSPTSPTRTYFVPARPHQQPTKAPVARPTSQTRNTNCKDTSNQFAVTGRGTKTCVWLSIRPIWQKKLCSQQKVKNACPKSCKACS